MEEGSGMENKKSILGEGKGLLRCTQISWVFSRSPHQNLVGWLCFAPPFLIQADGTTWLVHLLILGIIISTPCFLQLILDVLLLQLFVVADHKFFGKVLREIEKRVMTLITWGPEPVQLCKHWEAVSIGTSFGPGHLRLR